MDVGAAGAAPGPLGNPSLPGIPALAGQTARYTCLQRRVFKARTRTNDAGNMTSVSSTPSDDDILNLAHCIAGL